MMRWKKRMTGSYECDKCGGIMDWRFNFCGFCGEEAENPEMNDELEEEEAMDEDE